MYKFSQIKGFSFTHFVSSTTRKVWWLYVEVHRMGNLLGLGAKSVCGFFTRESKIISRMAAKMPIFSSPELKAAGELIGWPCSVVRPSSSVRRRPASVHNFKDLLLWNRWANQNQTSCGASLGRGDESLYKWSRSHDQDGRHAHIW